MRNLDPRVAVLIGLGLSVGLLAAPWPRLTALAGASWVLALATLTLQELRAFLKSAVLIAAITLFIGAWLSGDRSAAAWYEPTREGIRLGAVQSLRVASLGAVMAWLVAGLSVWRLVHGLEWTPGLSRDARARVHRAVFPLGLAWSMVPGLWEETEKLVEVQRLRRGPQRGRWTVRELLALVPGWIHAMAYRAQGVSRALVLRGYRGASRRNPRENRLGPGDFVGLVLGGGLLWYALG